MTDSNPQLKKRSPWRGLHFLAIGWSLVPLTLMLILAVGVTAVALESTVKSLAEERNLAQARLLAGRLSESIERHTLALRTLAGQPAFSTLDVEQMPAVFQTYEYLIADFVNDGGLIVLDAEGRVASTYPHRPELLGQDYANQPYFQNLLASSTDQSTFFDILPEPGTGRQIIGFAVPLMNETNRFSGVLVGRFYLDVQYFGRYIRPLQREEGITAYLVDRNGQVIFHPNGELIGSDFSAQPAVASLRQTGQAGAYIVQPSGSPREVVGYAPVGMTGWGLVISESWSRIIQPVQRPLLFIVGVFILGLLGLILVVLWTVRRVTLPLDRLVVQARQVAAGDYDTQVAPADISEIRELSLAFNHMVNQISSYRTGLHEYVASVTDSQEEERKRIARDLHDVTIQTLIAIGQRIELIRDTLTEQPLEKSKQQLTELRGMVKEAVASIRQFSRDLRPLALEDLGLIPALQYLVGQLEQEERISAELNIEGEALGLSQDLEVVIYRIIQEALSNIRKHAQAAQVFVTIRFLPRQTILEVQDNGIGFEVPENTTDLVRKGSFGLLGLEERANLFGGDISIQSAIGQGTIVRVILPHEQLPRRREIRTELDNNDEK